MPYNLGLTRRCSGGICAFGAISKTGVGYDMTYRLNVRDGGSYRWFRATGGEVLHERRQYGPDVPLELGAIP